MSKWEDNFNEIISIEDQKSLSGWGEDLALKKASENFRISSNEADFKEELGRIGGCSRYLPCPICFKCLNKSSHLSTKCQVCRIPMCVHTYEQRKRMIQQKNFEIKVSYEVKNIISSIGDKVIF